jgi:hypothetical protein
MVVVPGHRPPHRTSANENAVTNHTETEPMALYGLMVSVVGSDVLV